MGDEELQQIMESLELPYDKANFDREAAIDEIICNTDNE